MKKKDNKKFEISELDKKNFNLSFRFKRIQSKFNFQKN